MDVSRPPRDGDAPPAPAGDRRAWWLLLLALTAGQGWLTLGLFGGERPWLSLLDDRPIVSGRHPLHLYHGYLGARALLEHGNPSCYDPSYHAGYPKTPVFDSGSRPAELLLAVAGGEYRPAAYKLGVALLCAVVPLVLFLAGRGAGLSRAAACLACLLGQLVWWGQPCRDALEAGDLDLLLAALLMLAQAGLLLRFHRDPGLVSWTGIVFAALLGWFAHPLLPALLLPLFLVYYLSVGTRHRLAWHVALLGGLLGALAANLFWLIDWVGYWWIRVPPHPESPLLAEATPQALWDAPLWGGPADRALACGLAAAAAVGVVVYNQTGRRAAARLLGLAWVGFLALAAAGLVWESLGRLGSPRLLVPGLLFAVLPATHALASAGRLLCLRRATRWAGLAAAGIILALACAAGWQNPRLRAPAPLRLGLDGDQLAVVTALRQRTTDEARVLWEDRAGPPGAPHWTALLSLLTDRAYVGGLDPEAGIEHTSNGLADALLMGRPVRDWTDDELREYCRRYNVGWVACWSPASCTRFRAWGGAKPVAELPGGETAGCLFAVRREQYSFALVGSARWLGADTRRIVLGDVVPRREGGGRNGKGQVLLSLHYQAGMRVAPSRVRIESYRIERADPLADDSTPFVRLWVDEPVTRVTITWDKR